MESVALSLGNNSTKAFMHTHKRNVLIVLSSVHICGSCSEVFVFTSTDGCQL